LTHLLLSLQAALPAAHCRLLPRLMLPLLLDLPHCLHHLQACAAALQAA
jgi:hypothetical protein